MNSKYVIFATAALASLGAVSEARADFLDFRMFNNANYTQTKTGTAFNNYNFEMDDITTSALGFNSAKVTYPGAGSPASLTQSSTDHTFFSKLFGPYTSLAALHSPLPFGSYTTSFSNGTVTDSATINYAADHFQGSTPALTSASYTAIENWSPSGALTINFNSFTPDPATNDTVGTYVNINGASSTPYSTFLAPGATSVTIPAGTLLPRTAYTLILSQGGRISAAANSMGVETELGFAINDAVNFVTTPEPSSLIMCFLGLGAGWLVYRYRRGGRLFSFGRKQNSIA